MAEEKKENELEATKKPTSYDKCPPIQLIIRDNKGWKMYFQDGKTGKLHKPSDVKPCADADIVFADNGKYFAVILEDLVQIYKSSKCRFVTSFKQDRVRNVYFSPLNKFIIAYHHRRQQDENGNCCVWKFNKNKCELVHHLFVSEFNTKAVPFAITNDEFIAAQCTKNKLEIHDPKQLNADQNNVTLISSIEIPKIVSVVFAPCHRNKKQLQDTYILGVFAKATSMKAATVTIYTYKYSKSEEQDSFSEVSQRQFFGIDDCVLLWDSCVSYHHNLLVIVSSNVDTFGQSYYGNQELFLMSSQHNVTTKIETNDRFQDVEWHPSGKEFVVIYDHPHKIAIFDDKGKNIHFIGEYARNLIRFSASGNFLWLGGFGNLNGDMTFYDYKNIKNITKDDKAYLNGYNKGSSCRYFAWSPDSSLFLTASIYPFMTIENGFNIYKYNGVQLYEEKVDRLYQIAYRPSLANIYPDKLISVKALAQSKPLPPKQTKEEKAKTKYVAPHLRKKGNKNRGKYKATKRYFG